MSLVYIGSRARPFWRLLQIKVRYFKLLRFYDKSDLITQTRLIDELNTTNNFKRSVLAHNHNQILGRQHDIVLMGPGGDQHPKNYIAIHRLNIIAIKLIS